MRGGIDPGDHRFRPLLVAFLRCMEEFLIRGWVQLALSLLSPGWSSTLEFYIMRGGMDPGDHRLFVCGLLEL